MTDHIQILQLVNPTAEETTIKALCHGDMSTTTTLIETLDATDYHDQRYQVVFMAVANLLRGIEPIDTKAILEECRSLVTELKLKITITPDLVENLTGDVSKAVAYAATVKRMAWLRQAGDFATWFVSELQRNPDPNELFTAAQERFQVLQPQHENPNFVYGWDTIPMQEKVIAQRVAEYKEGVRSAFDWPWAMWNKCIRPLRAGMVGILAAPDGMGKTTYLEIIAEHWARNGVHVVYVHLEDELGYKRDRRDARHALVDMENIESGNLSDAELRQLNDAHERMGEWAGHLHYYDAAGKSMTEIVRELEARVSEGVCQAVVFDYLDKVKATRAQAKLFGDGTWERQADDMEALKTFAEKNKMPVFTATQGNKDMQAGGVQTRKNIQGSGQKSQKAQLVIILTRDIVGDGGLRAKDGELLAEAGEYSPIVNVRIDKQNRGKTGGFKQFLVGKFFIVKDIER